MERVRANPHIIEINTRVWLSALSRKLGRKITLATVPDEQWEKFKQQGFDAVWLMGVWKPSPAAVELACSDPGLRRKYDEALPGWTTDDVGGSPYAVQGYELSETLGGKEDLLEVKNKLNALGLRLILDFVCNHTAMDHPWTVKYPERFIPGTSEDLARDPVTYFETRGAEKKNILAHGKDPNFPAWTDTAQLNYFHPDTRREMYGLLEYLSHVCDGVRCDMAMLLVNEVQEQIWGPRLLQFGGEHPSEEFWPGVIARIKEVRPDFLFIAEVYWGLEWKLQEMGFDYTYDKTLYDRLLYMGPLEVRGHLWAEEAYQRRSVRFIENHDEARAAVIFGKEKSLSAAVAVATLKGMRLFYCGQSTGRKVRIPVQLVSAPEESDDPDIQRHYEKLFAATRHPAYHGGEWALLDVLQAPGTNRSENSVLSWCWRQGRHIKLVVINYSDAATKGWIKLPVSGSETIPVTEDLSGAVSERSLAEMRDPGFYVELEPFRSQMFSIST